MPQNKCVIDFEFGPVTRSMFDLLDCCEEILNLLPDYYEKERQELQSRCSLIAEVLEKERVKVCRKK